MMFNLLEDEKQDSAKHKNLNMTLKMEIPVSLENNIAVSHVILL